MHGKIYLVEKIESIPKSFMASAFLLLPEERRQKVIRYRQPIDRKNCIITYLMLKYALKECFQIEDFTLLTGDAGKPYLAEYPNIHFSISHCRCGCVVAVADVPIGIDIQDVRSFSWEIARRVCCVEELELLRRNADKDREFTRMWAMKESYIKMLGKGMKMNLMEINTLSEESVQVIEREKAIISVCMSMKKV